MIGGLSMTEVIIILGLALLLLGPDQLPTLAKSLGKGLKELRKATDDIKSQFESEIARIDINEPSKPASPSIAPVPPMGERLERERPRRGPRSRPPRCRGLRAAHAGGAGGNGAAERSAGGGAGASAGRGGDGEPASAEPAATPEVPAEEQKA